MLLAVGSSIKLDWEFSLKNIVSFNEYSNAYYPIGFGVKE